MIKILEKGTPKDIVFETKCHFCDSVLEYEKSDIHTDREGSYIECPVCGLFIAHKW